MAIIDLLINGLNNNQKVNIAASSVKVFDESMSAFKPQSSPTGNLPTIFFYYGKARTTWDRVEGM